MTTTDTLTLAEFDHFMLGLQEFLTRLRPTILLADRDETIRAAVDSLQQLVGVERTAEAPARAAPHSAAHATVSAPATAGHSAPTGTFDETVVLDFIRSAGRPVTRGALIQAFGVKPDQVQYRLKRLIARNQIAAKGKRGKMTFRALADAVAPHQANGKAAPPSRTAAPKSKPATTVNQPVASTRKQSATAPTDQSMLDLLSKAGVDGLTGPHIRSALNLSEGQFRATWEQLRSAGQAHKTGKVHLSRYHLGPAGQTANHETPKAAPVVHQAKRTQAAKASPTPATKKQKGRRGGATQGDVKTVLDFIAKNPGLRTEAIVKGLGADLDLVKAALKALRTAGSVTFTGIKRGTAYTAR